MKKSFLGMVVGLAVALAVPAADGFDVFTEYHEFYNKAGWSIFAKVIQYDVEAGKVELESTKGERAWVEMSFMSEADQAYVKQWHEQTSMEAAKTLAPEKDGAERTLSKEEKRDIGQNYVKAVMDKDYTLWCSLFAGLHGGDAKLNEQEFIRATQMWESISFGRIKDDNVEIMLVDSNGNEGSRWIQLLPTGEIKYDVFIFLHPFEEAFQQLHGLRARGSEAHQTALDNLEKLGVPCFGFDTEASDSERKKSIREIADWLLELDEDWDVTEPRLALPKERYKELAHLFKSQF